MCAFQSLCALRPDVYPQFKRQSNNGNEPKEWLKTKIWRRKKGSGENWTMSRWTSVQNHDATWGGQSTTEHLPSWSHQNSPTFQPLPRLPKSQEALWQEHSLARVAAAKLGHLVMWLQPGGLATWELCWQSKASVLLDLCSPPKVIMQGQHIRKSVTHG